MADSPIWARPPPGLQVKPHHAGVDIVVPSIGWTAVGSDDSLAIVYRITGAAGAIVAAGTLVSLLAPAWSWVAFGVALPTAMAVAALLVAWPGNTSLQLRSDGLRMGTVRVSASQLGTVELRRPKESSPFSVLRFRADDGVLDLRIPDPAGDRGPWLARLLQTVGTSAGEAQQVGTPMPDAMAALLRQVREPPR